jgi:hypothetical protein
MVKHKKTKDLTTISIRLPKNILIWLEKKCSKSLRSKGAEIIHYLGQEKENEER